MPREESTQTKLSRIRTPRVHITYEVETGGAIELKELPFVVAVLGDFSRMPEEELPKVKDRKLVEIDRDNFDEVLKKMKPRLVLPAKGENRQVVLNFNSMDDFHPDNIVKQVDSLRTLFEERQRLSDLLSKMDGNDKLEELLNDIVSNTTKKTELSTSLGITDTGGGTPGTTPGTTPGETPGETSGTTSKPKPKPTP